jgi:hypothetical protein
MDADCVRHGRSFLELTRHRGSFRLDGATPAFYGLFLRADKGTMMLFDRRRRQSPPFFLLLVIPLAFPSCGGPDTTGPSSGLTCIDDSPDCVDRRQKTLRYLVDDKDRAWIAAHPPPEAYASGVRLFALKNKKKDLTCDELVRGRDEADRAPGVLRGPDGVNLTPAQKSRGIMLASEVSRELGAEIKRRCKKA